MRLASVSFRKLPGTSGSFVAFVIFVFFFFGGHLGRVDSHVDEDVTWIG